MGLEVRTCSYHAFTNGLTLKMSIYFVLLGAFYHMTSPINPCRVMSSENTTVDLICQYDEGFMTSSTGSHTHVHVTESHVAARRLSSDDQYLRH